VDLACPDRDAAAAVAGLLAATEAAEPTGEHYGTEDVREELTAPNLRLPEGSVSVWDGARLLAYALTVPRETANPGAPAARRTAGPSRLPRPGPGRAVDRVVRARRRRPARAGLSPRAAGNFTRARTKASGDRGCARGRRIPEGPHLRDNADEPGFAAAAAGVPADLRLVPFAARFDEATWVAMNDAFAGHWGTTPYSPEMWRHRVTGSQPFRPEPSFLLVTEGGEVASFVLCALAEAGSGEAAAREVLVSFVGTCAALRGRGIAGALLPRGGPSPRAGFQSATLQADVDNAHNALGIYRRCGFEVTIVCGLDMRPMS
jgi:mycothiol synthase